MNTSCHFKNRLFIIKQTEKKPCCERMYKQDAFQFKHNAK